MKTPRFGRSTQLVNTETINTVLERHCYQKKGLLFVSFLSVLAPKLRERSADQRRNHGTRFQTINLLPSIIKTLLNNNIPKADAPASMETNKATFMVTSVPFCVVDSILMANHSLPLFLKLLSAIRKHPFHTDRHESITQKIAKECIYDSHRFSTRSST